MKAFFSRKLWVAIFTLIGIFAPITSVGAIEKVAAAVVATGYAIGQGMVDVKKETNNDPAQ